MRVLYFHSILLILTMDEDLERALILLRPILFCCSKLHQNYDGNLSEDTARNIYRYSYIIIVPSPHQFSFISCHDAL